MLNYKGLYMIKKIFLALSLFFGILSLSFGKSYMCIGEKAINIYTHKIIHSSKSTDKVFDIEWKHLFIKEGKFKIKTQGKIEKIKKNPLRARTRGIIRCPYRCLSALIFSTIQ